MVLAVGSFQDKMIKAVIFDLDGVIIDSEPIAYGILRDLVKPYGCDIPMDDYTTNYLGRTIARAMTTIRETFGIPLSEDELMALYLKKEKECISDGVPLKPGAKELISELKNNNIKMIVASSSLRERAEGILSSHNLLKFFDDLVFGYEVPKGKPSPDIFLKACEKLGVATEDAIVIEDSEAGIQASYSAGIKVICIPDMKAPSKEYKEKATYIVNSLYDVKGILGL